MYISSMRLTAIFLTIALFIFSGCTKAIKSSEVQSEYVSSAKYKGYSCKELIDEAEKIRAREPEVARQVDEHYKGEKNRELVTWLLFWPAAFGMDDGKDKSQRLGRIRGELEAIRSMMIEKGCGNSNLINKKN